MQHVRYAGWTLLLALLCACTPQFKPPLVVVEGVRIDRVGGGRAEATIMLSLANPNEFELSLDAATARLTVEDLPFGVARLKSPLSVPAAGNTTAELSVDTDLASMLQIAAVLARKFSDQRGAESATVRYAVSGTATFGGVQDFPFSRKGEVPLSRNRAPPR